MPKIFITRAIPEAGVNLLKEKGYEVEVSDFDGVLWCLGKSAWGNTAL